MAADDVLIASPDGPVIAAVAGLPNDSLSPTDVIPVAGDGTVKVSWNRLYGADGDDNERRRCEPHAGEGDAELIP